MKTLPTIVVSANDHARLSHVAQAALRTAPEVADYLLRELDRARIAQSSPGRYVEMGSHVAFRDNETGRVRSIQLVYPPEADPQAGRISVITPIGAALIGLSEGQTIPWIGRAGENRTLTVLKVGVNGGAVHQGALESAAG